MSGRRRVCGRWVGSRVKSSSPPAAATGCPAAQAEPELGHNQIRIDLHTQPGTLRHGNVALLVDCRRVAENREALAVVANRRVVRKLQQVASRPGCHEVQCGNVAYGFLYGTVRCHLPVESLGQHPDLSHIADSAREHRLRLQDIEDALLEHPVEFVNAEVVFSSGNRDTDLLPELGVLLERETRQGLFQPRTVKAFQFVRRLQSAAEIPECARLPMPGILRLVCIRHDLHPLADSRAYCLHSRDVLLHSGVVQA